MMVEGLIARDSAHDFATTLARLKAEIAARQITLFAEIDHAAGARAAGLLLSPTTLLIFGNVKAGTPLMQEAQTAGIDLPLKVLVWQAGDVVRVGYDDPAWIAGRHGLERDTAALSGVLKALVDAAAAR
jgi:uncharacterized protein (DUF302 family)